MDLEEISQGSNIYANSDYPEIDDELLFLDKSSSTYSIFPSKECILFLVDCAPTMHFLLDREKSTPLTTILKITENFLKTKIISNECDPFGIVLFNTAIKKNEMDLEAVNDLSQIELPNALLIKKLREIHQKCNPDINKDNYLKELNTIFRSNENLNKNFLNNGLLESLCLLKKYDKKNYKKTIFLFTDDDNPFKSDLEEKNACMQTAKEIIDDGIYIELFPMNFRDKFNLSLFYSSIISTNSDEDINSCGEYIKAIEEYNDLFRQISKRIRRKEMKKRYLTKCPFRITKNTKIYVNIYSNIKMIDTRRLCYMDIKSKKLVKSSKYYKCKESGKELSPNELGNYIMFAGKKITFSREDLKNIKIKEEPGMTLLGFKSFDKIYPYYNSKESYFVYPNDYYSNGAGKLTYALINQMSNKKKCAIVRYIAMEGSVLKICALMPQIERYNDCFCQNPPGFNMIILPWADDIRLSSDILSKFPQNLPYISNKQSELARKIIKKLYIRFDCHKYQDYSKQKFYSTLQSLATSGENEEKIKDTLMPNEDLMDRILDGIDENYRQLIFGDTMMGNEKKRKTEEKKDDSSSERSPIKRSKYKRTKKRNYHRKKKLFEEDEDEKDNGSQKENKKENKKDKKNDSSSSESVKRDYKKYKRYKKKKVEKKERSSDSSSSKKRKSSSDSSISVSDLTNTKLTRMFKTREIEDMTVNQLKRICFLRGISTRILKKHEILSKLRSKLYIMTH